MYLHLKSQIFEYLEQRRVEKVFYRNGRFAAIDAALLRAYCKESPYQISKQFLEQRGEISIHAYGETPLTTMEKIAKACAISGGDTVIELGSGRGRVALFLAEYVGCQVVACEQIPQFIEKMVPSERVVPYLGDMLFAPFSKATVIYLYGTMLTSIEIEALIDRFPEGVKILTVSYPLSDYSDKYRISKVIPGRFPWGKTEVYCNERISP